ncbi:FLYWCH-type zinc finger-containing protein 1 isoform X1 [Heterocephalus glaber]|uniref:FLYWCH-type zinc finger-containing protein 1 n=2 Tax=Heterocephalus glaber TaxID=10181 RepID=A0AAX6QKZ7_HETGA|nr:FLYWCH-type zinc finger-containing protein 1 isoform X1 [Heterocephalus glaber]XP_012921098.1 FLYWCH-type zinc finger-containing protein 1 isoform X1 [Heterocephalus glaber]XP_012921099.1 FLYWCH-type zinc finger-containing protein 1 isoform X1 [Heterocephalus glaber]XP_012921100.1 FLYWCH-type zinc finger-containing protein 1 isoform X1 [Heterocephalus glaber]XP_012921101.1 FLYWCH-type zinc finger-containing protein 1 isoform X1 [Heterocephalus glaber]XP_012921102.1 FLYWCH-type zinc finger-c
MPLPEPSEQEGESMKAAQEPSPETSMDVVPADPSEPQEFSNLVLLTTSDQQGLEVDSDPTEVHCVISLEMVDPSTLASTLQILPAEEQVQAVQPCLWSSGLKRSKVEQVSQPLEFLRTPFGGRLLVLESFLYKQEKAVGDKVYWKCRQHAELGCRGRAITRGSKATVMRDHCHPPDEEGLEARRQKEKLPSSALPDSLRDPQGPVEELLRGVDPWLYPEEPTRQQSKPVLEDPQTVSVLSLPPKKRQMLRMGLPPGLEFLNTCYGGTFLVHQSFIYKREKAVGDKVYWTCRDHTLHGCRSRAISQGHLVTVMRSHCHPPDMESLQVRRRQQEKAIRTLQARPLGLGGCRDKRHQSMDSHQGLGAPTLAGSRLRKKAKVKGQELSTQTEAPQGSPEEDQDTDPGGPEFLRTPLGGSFLVYESFLYRREKAAGDKVYWTCRDQARMGCRSRAITQGRQVTVMRGHCHPPDLLGLETMRQRDKHPSPTHRESLGGPEFIRTPLGGSFLVYESFLYRREKATGDKVYWTCRDQARMGCRSRAITQGQRVMVMRRHCHPPDLGGLEALRQREHLPNLAQWEGPEPQQPLEFLRTSLGGRFLVYESFLYRKEKAAGEKVYWMCRDQARLGCRSRAITQGRRVMVMRSHCHQPDLASLEALRQRERLPNLAQQENPEKIKLLPEVQLCIETCSESQQICGNVKKTRPDCGAQ